MHNWNEYPFPAAMLRMGHGMAFVLMWLIPMQLMAQDPADFAMLPVYCKYTQTWAGTLGTDQAEKERWYQRLGPTMHHMHHYCRGLLNTMEARKTRDQQFRTHKLGQSINEFDYVLARAPKDFVLLPEIHFRKGENLMKLNQPQQAINAFNLSIAAKPDYWPPHPAISDFFKGAGDTATARQWLEKGLAASPNTKALESRLAELGGAKGKSRPSPKSVEPTEKPKP